MTRTSNLFIALSICALLALSVTACGQRGALYLPEDKPEEQQAQSEASSEEIQKEDDEENP